MVIERLHSNQPIIVDVQYVVEPDCPSKIHVNETSGTSVRVRSINLLYIYIYNELKKYIYMK